ncbi:O-acyltransferase like protein-like isoform X2 [Leptopilina boulardi]|uniref:O-acyltransferase like protein-like isoform X2 n=1 Tax=Leptopilina boulardi TaxID=63433 RepID=UPI0021F6001E|nr:O-acyltransferase like protein-like isoform X2 [Leptopilina boulardi]
MNFNFFTSCVLIQLIVSNYLISPLVFGEVTKKIQIYNKDLENNERFYNFNESNYSILNKLHSTKSVYSEKSESDEKSSWFLNIPLLPIIVATSNSIPDGSCKRQLRLYLEHLKNGTLWATEMFDSSAKYPYGLFGGLTRHLGSFDQCDRIQTKIMNKNDGEIEEIRGRYCLVDVKFKEENEPTNSIGEHKIFFDPQVSAWEAIREKGDFRRYIRYFLQMALCFPAKCKTEDIVAALKEPLDEFGKKYNIQVTASILPLHCSSTTSKGAAFSNYETIFCLTFFLIFTVIIISTIMDINSDKKGAISLPKELLNCFSARENWNKIFNITYAHPAFECIYFIRVLMAGLTVIAHRQLQYMYAGNISGRYLEWVLSNPTFGLAHNFSVIVDAFFGVGGLLLSYSLLEILNKSQKLDYMRLILNRLMRILPLYMFVTFGYATIFHRIGSGPFWESRVGFNRDSCSSNWWTNLFLINNYFGGNNKCVAQSWYLAVDFQCYLFGLILITAFNKMSRKIGYIFLCCILIISTALTFYFTYKNNADPVFTSYVRTRRIEEIDYFLNYYLKTHLRLAAYVTGLICGAFMFDCKNAEWRLSKVWSQIFYLTAILLAYTTMWSGTLFMNPNLKITALSKALYASLHRPIFAFSICAMPLLFTIGHGLDFYKKIINARWLQPISRISYAIFLTHGVLILYELGTIKTPITFSFYNGFRYTVGDFIFTMLLGLFFAILIEFPFRNVGYIILKKQTIVIEQKQSSNIKRKAD